MSGVLDGGHDAPSILFLACIAALFGRLPSRYSMPVGWVLGMGAARSGMRYVRIAPTRIAPAFVVLAQPCCFRSPASAMDSVTPCRVIDVCVCQACVCAWAMAAACCLKKNVQPACSHDYMHAWLACLPPARILACMHTGNARLSIYDVLA